MSLEQNAFAFIVVNGGLLERSLGPELNFEGKVEFGLAEESGPVR